jgi:hypothetical protein
MTSNKKPLSMAGAFGERALRDGSWQMTLSLALTVLAPLCGEDPLTTNPRQVPACAQMDCVTGKIVDNGCSVDGRCMACVNSCNTAPLEPK